MDGGGEMTQAEALQEARRQFRVAQVRGKYYRLTHIPSGDYVQRHLSDFLTRKDALECRNRIISSAPEWDWCDPNFFQEIPWETFTKVWHAIYANGRPKAAFAGANRREHAENK
jgi:hypothetical protein